MSEPKCWHSSVVTLTFWLQIYRYLPLSILHLFLKHESCTLKTRYRLNFRNQSFDIQLTDRQTNNSLRAPAQWRALMNFIGSRNLYMIHFFRRYVWQSDRRADGSISFSGTHSGTYAHLLIGIGFGFSHSLVVRLNNMAVLLVQNILIRI